MLMFRRLVCFGAAAAAAWGAYVTRATPMVSALLLLVSVGLVAVAWRSARKRSQADMFQDLSVSTLVFPPESRPKRSAWRPR